MGRTLERPKHCTRYKVNRRSQDFTCDLGFGHTDAHHDPLTGTFWRHPTKPYGMRGDPPTNGPRGKTKQGVQWSDRPARH